MASASLAWLIERGCERIRLHCTVLGCNRSGTVYPAALAAKHGGAMTLAQIERAAACEGCGAKGRCSSEPIIISTPRMGMGDNAWPEPPKGP